MGYRRLFIAAALLAASLAAAAPPAFAGKPDPFDPHPAPDDLIMPMPCGGAMVFRKVATSNYQGGLLGALLGDRRVVLGSPDESTAYSEYSRADYIAGAFAENDKQNGTGTRYFLLGKYEVSKAQYDAVMSEGANCPKDDFDAALPVTSVSWFDAVEFTRRYSSWLYKNAFDKLPTILGAPGFVRLPTETEWEFAERGGLAVPPNEFQKRVFSPDGQQLQGYAWFAGQNSADGALEPIGTTQFANPLGFYDMLGNASEMVLDPFHLIRGTREHGLVGGFIAKGGSFETPQSEMRSSMREEFSYFNPRTKAETKARQMGFRVSMADVALPDLRSINALKQDWDAARQAVTDLPGKPLDQLAALAKNQADPMLRSTLDTIRVDLTTELTDAKDARKSANEASIFAIISMQESLGTMLKRYNEDVGREASLRENLATGDQANSEHYNTEIKLLELDKLKIANDFYATAGGYVVLLTHLAERYGEHPDDAAEVTEEIQNVNADMSKRGKNSLIVAANLLRALNTINRTGDRTKMKVLEDVFGPLNLYQ
jgi:formylglycine-generating enzyme required for sulfatase activity